MNDRGYYQCKDCKILIQVETMSKLNDGSMQRKIIHKCPSCFKKLNGISENLFNNIGNVLYIHLKRTYYKKSVEMGIKFYNKRS